MGVAILTQHVVNACQRKLSDAVLTTKELTERWSASFIKVSGRMRSNAFKRTPGFNFTVTILAKNNFLLLLKLFITMALKYKAVLKL